MAPLPARMAWYTILESRMQKEGLPSCFRTARYSQSPKRRRRPRLSQVYQFAGWRRQDDLWRMAGAHRGPSPSLAVWLCSQSRGYRLPGYPLGHLGACCKGRLVPKRTAVGHCQGLRHVGQRAAFLRCDCSKYPLRHKRPTGPLPAGSHAHQKGRLLDSIRKTTWAQASSDEATMLLWPRRLVVRNTPMGLPEASIDISVSGYAEDWARAAAAKNLTEFGQINREQTDSLRAALESRALQLHPTKGIVLLRAAGRNSLKDYQAACTGAWPAPEHISLQAKYLGALRTIEGTAKAECRARCQAAEASCPLYALFFRSQARQCFKVLVFKAAIVGTLLAALETGPLDAHDFHHLEVELCSLARRFLGRNAYEFEGGRIVKKLGAAVTRRLALCPPVVIQLRQRRLKWRRRQLIWEQSTGHPPHPLQLSSAPSRGCEPPVKTDGTLSPAAPRLQVIIADDLKAVGLPLTSPTWNVDLIQGRLSMPSEENPLTDEDEPALPLELQHPCDECEWIGRSEGSLRGHKIIALGYRSQIEISCPQSPQCGKKFATISNARVHIKRQSCSRSFVPR